jgi:hypothetical protein
MTIDQVSLIREALENAYILERIISDAPVLQLHEYIRILAIIARLERVITMAGLDV